jgi:undecaprenyl-diphosphatase
MFEPFHAVVLGAVEGLTEFLPISSTGHLILTSHWLGLHGEGLKTFEIVIQVGAIVAVLGLYRGRVRAAVLGLIGRDPAGLQLFVNLLVSFLPAAVLGALLHDAIKRSLFGTGPVVAALAVGGVAMIVLDRPLRARGRGSIEDLTWRDALLIGTAQCLALWPGTSRAMVTMLAGMGVGLRAPAAAEYSFLLALPTLAAAAVFAAFAGGGALTRHVGGLSIACGLLTAAAVAALVMRGFIQYLARHGLSPFGWYRVALAAIVWSAGVPG